METIKVEKTKGIKGDMNTGLTDADELVIDEWFDEQEGEVDAFRLFNKIESIKSAHREQAISENVKRQRLKELKEYVPTEERENLLESSSRSVCVSNLPKYVNESQLRQLFHELSVGMTMQDWISGVNQQERYGAMLDAQEQGEGILSQAITRVKIMRGAIGSEEETECIGYAFVEFETPAHAKAVIDKVANTQGVRPLPKGTNDTETAFNKDIMVKIGWATTSTRAPLDLYQVYIANVPKQYDEYAVLKRIRDIISKQTVVEGIDNNDIISVDLMKDPVTNENLDFGFLRVKESELSKFWNVYESMDDWKWDETIQDEYSTNEEEKKVEEKGALMKRAKKKNAYVEEQNRINKVKEKLCMKGNQIFLKRSYQRPSTSRVHGNTGTAEAIANTTLFMANITPAIVEQELKELLMPFGPIVSFRMARMKNLAFITYAYAMSALAALTHLNGVEMKGQRLHLSYGYSRFAVPKHIREELGVDMYASKDDDAFGVWKESTLEPVDEKERYQQLKKRLREEDETTEDGSKEKNEKEVKKRALQSLVNEGLFGAPLKLNDGEE